jgi:hypothetical protein
LFARTLKPSQVFFSNWGETNAPFENNVTRWFLPQVGHSNWAHCSCKDGINGDNITSKI